ncbi:MAG: Bax inhibitor-1/YccA family protein [Planctomycetota bacterium]
MRTSNPALNANVFTVAAYEETSMTINGTVNKTGILVILAFASAAWTWHLFSIGANFTPLMLIGVFGGFITAIVTVFKKDWASVTAPIYAILEGLFLGGISAVLNARFPGIVIQAIFLTFGTLACLLMAYRSGLIRATENFKLGVVAATGGICLVYFISIILGFFGVQIPLIHSNGIIGIGFSLFVVVIAALNLVLDFDFIENGAQMGAPKYMEWYAAFGLMVTLVWLYIEILRLLAKLNSRR